jgi:hypothetical protein
VRGDAAAAEFGADAVLVVHGLVCLGRSRVLLLLVLKGFGDGDWEWIGGRVDGVGDGPGKWLD